jgi:RNA ligase
MFPVINKINDILPFIKDHPNFYVNKKDDYIVIDYILNTPDMFLNPEQKECRGILFYEDGRIMSRRLHKFFNFNEREESRLENVDLSEPHVILEKLDGSMVTVLYTKNQIRWGSKAGITFITNQVEDFIEKQTNINYIKFGEILYNMDYTPIFEWCSRKNRIVIDHPVDKLILLAIRNNITGEYVNIHS